MDNFLSTPTITGMDEPSTAADHAAIRKSALARKDFVTWLANALENRARHRLSAHVAYSANDAELDREAAAQLRNLIE